MGDAPFDIDARMAQITGKPPRIEPLAPEELSAEGMALILKIRASVGAGEMGFIPEYFRTMVKHPALFKCVLELGTAIFTGTIGGRERELAVLRIGWLCRAPYEWGEHANISKRYGVTAEEVERVTLGSSAPGWSEHDAAILRGVEELLDDKMISDATWAILAGTWSEQQLIEFPTLVGAYVATAFTQNALRMRLAEDNPGLSYR